MLKTMFSNIRNVFKGSDTEEVNAYLTSLVKANGMEGKVVIEGSYFMPASMENKDACYIPEQGRILINLNLLNNPTYRLAVIKKFKSIEVFLDVLVSHELGHAFDPNVHTLLMMANNHFYDSKTRGEALLLCEMNAWKYGRRFTSYPELYEQYNDMSYKAYESHIRSL